MTLPYPWLLFALPLPLLVRWLGRPHAEARPALQVSFLERLARLTGREPAVGAVAAAGSWVQRSVLVVVWGALMLALARPQWAEDPIVKTVPTRDLLVAVDLSGSMETEDFTDASGQRIDRVTAVRQVLDEFFARRKGDRVGLIFFGNAPFVQVPFTEDLDVCRELLREAQARMAGPQTMMGDAIGLAIHVFERSDMQEKVLILLTDGNDTGSGVEPVKAAEIARDNGITVHAIAMGDPQATGEEKFDEPTLRAIAEITGGRFFRAMDREELEGVYRALDELTAREMETESYRPVHDLFHLPLAAAILLSLLYHAVAMLRGPGRRKDASGSVPVELTALASFAALGASGGTLPLHFLRPAWLLLLVPVAILLAWQWRRRDPARRWQGIIDPHLLDALLASSASPNKIRPLHLLALVWLLGCVALAGPAWRREASPFTDDQASLAIVLKTTPSMLDTDVQPTRLERAVHKIRDLLAERPGAKTALIAYSGSAHLVMPLTRDAGIIESFATELQPDVMPTSGDRPDLALALAQRVLRQARQPGSVLWIADEAPGDLAGDLASQGGEGGFPLLVLGLSDRSQAGAGGPENLERAARALGGAVTWVAPDGRDVNQLARRVARSMVDAPPAAASGERWRDEGYWLVPLVCLLVLPWFRRGWVVQEGAA